MGGDIGITIVTPGFIESEMTKGRYLTKEGEMEVDQEIRDVLVGFIPVGYTEECAKAILNSACRGDRYLTMPSWFRVLYLWRVLCPEVLEWCYRLLYVTGPGASQRDAPSKMILHLTGAKNLLYSSSIQSSHLNQV
ncbi:hypothetical protein NE237_007297 [Protea cynaroides]|uniref:Uncharacterized protein n=1 Tax=Protea cynaroides TaxID=273540 RepID=A0A9Q0KP18_9MAGN|nr:hypothetical protein NE237_007297 [Protea cynaroides]